MRKFIFILLLFWGVQGYLDAQRVIGSHLSLIERREEVALDSILRLPKTDAEIVVNVGDIFCFSAREHGSIGKYYKFEYDKEAFEVKGKTQYDNPERDGKVKPGGDAGTNTYIFTPQKQGTFQIKVIRMDKTKIKKIIKYKITVI